MNDLTPIQAANLREHEQVIESGIREFVKVGRALAAIRDEQLYRNDFTTFDAYCRERWGMSKPRAYQYINSAVVAENVESTNGRQIENERQARELGNLSADQQAETYQEVIEATDGKPTAKAVKEAVKKKQPTLEAVEKDREAAKSFHQRGGDDADDEFEPAEPYLNADLDAVKSGYLALSQAKQIAFRDWLEDQTM